MINQRAFHINLFDGLFVSFVWLLFIGGVVDADP